MTSDTPFQASHFRRSSADRLAGRSHATPHNAPRRRWGTLLGLGLVLSLGGLVTANFTSAAEAAVDLGTAKTYGVLAGAGVTNSGTTTVYGDLGTCPNNTVTGDPDVRGEIHAADDEACAAQAALATAYGDAAGRAPTTTYAGARDLGAGPTLTAGVYRTASSFGITGTLTLDGQENPDAVFIFQAGETLITATDSRVELINGAQACNVFWQVGSSATLEVASTFVGTVMAYAAIAAKDEAVILGRLLARTESVTLDDNEIRVPTCEQETTGTTGGGVTTTTDGTGATTSTTTDGAVGATTTTEAPTTPTTEAPTTPTTEAPTTPTTEAPTTPTTDGSTTPTTDGSTTPTTEAPPIEGSTPVVPAQVTLTTAPLLAIATAPSAGTTATTRNATGGITGAGNTGVGNTGVGATSNTTTSAAGANRLGATSGARGPLASTGTPVGEKMVAAGVAILVLGAMLVAVAGRRVIRSKGGLRAV